MREKRYMIDTNVFIAAFRSGYTTTTRLLLELIFDDSTEFVGDDILIKEYEKWFNIITAKHPETRDLATLLLTLILSKIRIVKPKPSDIEKSGITYQKTKMPTHTMQQHASKPGQYS